MKQAVRVSGVSAGSDPDDTGGPGDARLLMPSQRGEIRGPPWVVWTPCLNEEHQLDRATVVTFHDRQMDRRLLEPTTAGTPE